MLAHCRRPAPGDLDYVLVRGNLRQSPIRLYLVKLGKLLVKMPHCRIGGFLRHFSALLSPLDVERAIVFRAHANILTAAGSDPPFSRRDVAPAQSATASSYYNSMDNHRL